MNLCSMANFHGCVVFAGASCAVISDFLGKRMSGGNLRLAKIYLDVANWAFLKFRGSGASVACWLCRLSYARGGNATFKEGWGRGELPPIAPQRRP